MTDLICTRYGKPIVFDCPCCSEKISMTLGDKEDEGNVIYPDPNGHLGYDMVGEGEEYLNIWYMGVCPKCGDRFAIADRIRIGGHDTIGYDYAIGEHNYDIRTYSKEGQ